MFVKKRPAYFCVKTRLNRYLAAFLAAVMTFVLTACGNSGQSEKTKLTVYLCNENLLETYAPTLQAMVPEAELEFVVGRNSADFYLFRQENGDLPDIITTGTVAFRDTQELNTWLMDLSGTETAASFYATYLESYRDDDGVINWLPAGGVSNGILANVELFEQYDIPLPTDYDSFVAACEAFQEVGVCPYSTDYKYDYTCLYTLEGWSIPAMNGRQGSQWRRSYERGLVDGLDESLWLNAFERLADVIETTGMGPDEVTRGYTINTEEFSTGNVAMTRGMDSEISAYSELFDCQLLPYFCEDSNWILSTPRFHVALNGALDGDGNEQKKELALKVLAAMFSSEGYEAMLTDGYIYMLPYNRGVDVALPESMSNLQPLIDANQLFILMTSDTLNAAAMSAVQGMLLGELDTQSAYERMNELLIDPVVDQTVVATLDEGWPVSFQAKKGNQAASAMANTMRQLGGTELLLAPASLAPGSLYAVDYTDLRLEESMKSGGIRIYSCTLTGAEVREFVRLMVEGYDSVNDPFSDQTLPVSSGFVMEVEKTAEGGYRLTGITVDGEPLDDGAEYSFAVVDLPPQFQPLAELALGEGAVERFAVSEDYARTMWVDYLKEGNQPVPPTEYIRLTNAEK